MVLRVLSANQLIGSFKECEHLRCLYIAMYYWADPMRTGEDA